MLTNSHKAGMIAYMKSHPEDFTEIIKLAVADKQPYSWRASWLLWSCMNKNDQRIRKYLKTIIDILPNRNDSQQRELLMILHGICYYDGKSFANFTIHPSSYTPPANTNYRSYGVYCTLVDKSGKVWFGTQEKGVCVYNGINFSFIDNKDLAGPAVRSIFQDKSGILWFGNNGGGLFRYDGKTLRNITEENNLINYEFLREKKLIDKQGSLARVFAINEDDEGNLWVGTVDAGVWKYDGRNLTNYSSKDGIPGNSVYVIFKDKKGKLWFVSNGETLLHFDGQKFYKAIL